ncbi:fibronectin type III-like domain-contianing protein [Leifsonia sp. L25]|uniref:fibronectin type III-like domain-contianing protein n=1 Tax=Leifsonia sp. L25 TaxID=3423957 RepID=UPI003D686210
MRYPFGHGLSYTGFAYGDLQAEVVDPSSGRVRVTCTVANTGPVAGAEIVQLYVGDPEAEVHRPVRELRGFEKVGLEPGETVTVSFDLVSRDFAYWDTSSTRPDGRSGLWRREGGDFTIEVGASSRDIRLATTITLPDDPTIPPLVRDWGLRRAEEGGAPSSRFVQGHAG